MTQAEAFLKQMGLQWHPKNENTTWDEQIQNNAAEFTKGLKDITQEGIKYLLQRLLRMEGQLYVIDPYRFFEEFGIQNQAGKFAIALDQQMASLEYRYDQFKNESKMYFHTDLNKIVAQENVNKKEMAWLVEEIYPEYQLVSVFERRNAGNKLKSLVWMELGQVNEQILNSNLKERLEQEFILHFVKDIQQSKLQKERNFK